MSYLDLRYAETAIDISYLDSMFIANSDFVYNEAAIDVGATAKNDPALGALACVPPYLSFVFAVGDWFGATGYPAPSIDVNSVVGTIVPEEYASLFGEFSSIASISAPLYPGDNTIPFSIYSCSALGMPPIPVTPVLLREVPTEPWFPDLEAE